jgi:transitional endoplasmic reticulum ATPase
MPKQATQAQLISQAVSNLRVIGGELVKEDELTFEGNRYIIPERYRSDPMEMLNELTRYVQSQEEEIVVSKVYEYLMYDGAHAVWQVLRQAFGYAMTVPNKTFFGKEPAQEVTIAVGYQDGQMQYVTVPQGKLVLPGVPGCLLQTGYDIDPRGVLFKLSARCKRKDKATVDGFMTLVEQYLDNGGSIYEGKAMTADMTFVDVDAIDPHRFIYSEQAWADIETSVLSPLRDRDVLAGAGLSVKRATLLEGPYGTGKSGMGAIALKVAQANGVTAISCRPGQDDPFQMLQTLQLYASRGRRGFGFIEDVDVFAAEQDPQWVTRLLDAFDSARNKGLDITLVMTTNHKEDIHKGMLRPGRLDAIIEIGAMDRPGVEKLARMIIGDQLADDVDFDQVYAATEGYMPAFVREGVERALRYTIARTGQLGQITTVDLVRSLNSLRPQFDLHEAANDRREKLPPLDRMFRQMIGEQALSEDTISGVVDHVVENRLNGAQFYDENGDHRGELQTN